MKPQKDPEKVNKKELYKIINRALSHCCDNQDERINQESRIFLEKYTYYTKTDGEQNLFDPLPTLVEVKNACKFCNLLEKYRDSINEYNQENEPLSLEELRSLHSGMLSYKENIYPENKEIYNRLENILKNQFPENRENVLLDEYIRRVQVIKNERRDYQKKRRKKIVAQKSYEISAENFIRTISHDEELKNLKASPKKIKLCEEVLDIVDCLGDRNFNRSHKFRIKRQLNEYIFSLATSLGEGYEKIAQNAASEVKKYNRAIDRARQFQNYSKDIQWGYE